MGYYGDYYKPSRPREARGGIKSQAGKAGQESWWARRWLAVLEGFNIGGRLARGRTYARQGQVLSIEVEKGVVRAKVQGSRPRPYDVTITVKRLSDDGWKTLARALAQQAIFAAKLLAGEMPQDIETVFEKAKLSLFPEKRGDLTTACTCPDESNPCKHIAAVYYLLGDEFHRDPFLIFRLRGIEREELLDLIHEVGEASAPTPQAAPEPAEAAPAPPEPLTPKVPDFWNGGSLADDWIGEVQVPPVPAPLPRRLGGFPFWRGNRPLLEVLEPAYVHAAPRGLNAFLGDVKAR